MSRVTSKLQVTIPRAVADRYGIAPGVEIAFEPAGDVIRVLPPRQAVRDPGERVKRFEEAVARQRQREAGRVFPAVPDRGWTREEL
jgi:bifunctional DNA-binding transcriptional regulator/antitoxin component of YhaV-PrlF toxin-antitoxin module